MDKMTNKKFKFKRNTPINLTNGTSVEIPTGIWPVVFDSTITIPGALSDTECEIRTTSTYYRITRLDLYKLCQKGDAEPL